MAKKKESNIISTAADLGSSDILSMISSFDDKSEILDEAKASKIKEYIGTGSFILNAAMTGSIYGGIPSGRVVSFAGEAGVGKTFLAVSACREAQKKGWTPIYLDSENSIDPSFIERLGCDPKNFIIRQVSTVKEVTTFISNLCKTFDDKGVDFPKVVIVLDSIGNLTSDKEFNDSIEGKSARDMTRAQEVKAMFRVITTSLGRLSIPMIVTNHVYSCFSSGTKILDENNNLISIEDIKVGDKVLTLDGPKNVLNTFKLKTPYYCKLEFSDGSIFKCTPNHKFAVKNGDNIIWKSCIDLQDTDEIIQIF